MEDAWRETCLIAIAKQGGADMRFHALTETVDFDIADKDIEGIALVNGGRVTKYIPQGDSTITFEAYTNKVSTVSGTVGAGFWGLLHTEDSSEPIEVNVDRVRNKYRVAVLWTTDTTAVIADQAVSAKEARRFVAANGYFTSWKQDFTDGILKVTAQYKVTAFAKDATANMVAESADGTGTMLALGSFTTSANW